MTDRLVRDGQVAVLISPGYGAGWSTWAQTEPDLEEQFLFDPQIADILLGPGTRSEKIERVQAVASLKYPEEYLGGIEDLEVVMLKPGTRFRVREHDGNEWIETEREIEWKVA